MKDLLERLMKVSEELSYPESAIDAVRGQLDDVFANLEADLMEASGSGEENLDVHQLVDEVYDQVRAIVAGGVANDDVMQKTWKWGSGDDGSMKVTVDGIVEYVGEIKKDLTSRFGEDEMHRIFDAAWAKFEEDME